MIYPMADWRPVANHGGPLPLTKGLILHRQEGYNSLRYWFNDPKSSVSAHWWIARNGTIEQYVDSNLIAWAQAAGNYAYHSVEIEGYTHDDLTPPQIASLAALYRWGMRNHGWKPISTDRPGDPGLGWHGMGGVEWGNHPDCPGEIVKSARDIVLKLAQGGNVKPNGMPAAIKLTQDGGGYWIFGNDGGVFTYGNADFHGSAFGVNEAPIASVDTMPDGSGYVMIDQNWNVYAYPDTLFHGHP